MGSIYKRGSVYWLKYYRNGKPYRESAKTEKETEAKRLLKKREGEISEGKIPGVYYDRIRFGTLVEDFLTDYRINNRKSLDRAERSARQLKLFFDNDIVPSITSDRISSYIDKRLEDGMEEATINRELAALKRMFKIGQRHNKVDRIPYIEMLEENNVREGFFEHGEFIALREAITPHLKGFVTFAYKTGWRVSEIKSLTWAQVDLINGIVRLEAGTTKNKKGREARLDEELKSIFQEQKTKQIATGKITPFVFTNAAGTGSIKDFRGSWETACSKAKIGKKLFHDFRRTAVRNMVRAGIPERVAMMISGHKTRSVFERYNIVSERDLIMAAQQQEAYLRAQSGHNPGTVETFPVGREVNLQSFNS